MENIAAFTPALLCIVALAMKGEVFAVAKKEILSPDESLSEGE